MDRHADKKIFVRAHYRGPLSRQIKIAACRNGEGPGVRREAVPSAKR
jgi:hypothetical protein